MDTAGRPLGRDRTAIAASIALHLCAVLALATLPHPTFPTDDPDERLLVVTTIRVQHAAPSPRPARARRALVPHTETARLAFRPVIHAAVTVERATRALVVAPEAPNAYSHAPPAAPAHRSDVNVSQALSRERTADTSNDVSPAPTPMPTPMPAPTAAPAAAVAQTDEGIGNFGESYPASIEPTLRSALVAVGSGFDVRVTVDENGRATSIEFVRSPPDTTLREALRAKLLAARFIPAACNGLRCAGTVELRT